jgi:putative glutathione S-transferase
VPVLWDRVQRTIVNNESAEIIRILNSGFDGIGAAPGDWYPAALRPEIDAVNARVYATLNNGVYRAGFARSQAAYDAAVQPLFETLDWLEARLQRQPYLCGDRCTEADWRLFTTLIRFDSVYHTHFKCNRRRVVDYPALWDHTRSLYQLPGVAETVDLGHITRHYYGSHRTLNPFGIVPIGPVLDLDRPGTRVPPLPPG